MLTLNCKGKLISLQKPLVMGIINATPDSFYKGDLLRGMDEIKLIAEKMIAGGADIIDVGGQSTRPGSQRLNAKEESDRVIPVIKMLHAMYPNLVISVDTYHAVIAKNAIDEGAGIVNDISGGTMDEAMLHTVAKAGVPYVCMHMKGTPENMHIEPSYENVVDEVMQFFIKKIYECEQAGIKDIIIDPGFGFGKTIEHNFTLLNSLSLFKIFNKPVLAGLSRKSTIYKTLGIDVEHALNGTTVMNTLALANGADILRVHDVKEAKEAITLTQRYKKAAPIAGSGIV
ncbi:MAG: dihydropteroate synthase [Ferruginibacter sp.]